MRPPVAGIAAPPFPPQLLWINAAPLRIDQQLGRPVLIEFWDFCRANSIRTLPYMGAWHTRYEPLGLCVIGVHMSGFEPSRDPDAIRAAIQRLDVRYPVVVDAEHEIWDLYGNLGWPARYLFDQRGLLVDYHYGEGAYTDTEQAIQALLGVEREPFAPLRPEDAPGALLTPQTPDVEGPYSGPYEAGAVWAVLDGSGAVTANGTRIEVEHPGCYELVSHPYSTAGELELEIESGVRCYGVCFTPGLVDPHRADSAARVGHGRR